MADIPCGNCSIVLSAMMKEEFPRGDRGVFFVDTNRIFGLFTSDTFFNKAVMYTVRWCYFMRENGNVERKVLLESKIEYDLESRKREKTEKMRLVFNLNNSRRFLPPGDYSVEIIVDEGNSTLSRKDFKVVKRSGIYLGTKVDQFGIIEPSPVFYGHEPVILGTYHFDEIKSYETVKDGKIEWYSLQNDEEHEQQQEEELIYIYNVDIPEKGQFNEFRFFLPKEKLLDEKYSPGQYKCVVYVNDIIADQKAFEITPPKPCLYIGTKLTKNVEIFDDGKEIEGSSEKIIALYKFCRQINGNRKGRVKWLKLDHTNTHNNSNEQEEKTNEEKEQVIYEHEIDFQGLDFELFISFLDNSERKLLPGRYSCEVYIDNDELLAKKYFLVLPRFEIVLGTTTTTSTIMNRNCKEEEEGEGEEQEQEEEDKEDSPQINNSRDVFQKGGRRINGSFTSNYVFPSGSEVSLTWLFFGSGHIDKNNQKKGSLDGKFLFGSHISPASSSTRSPPTTPTTLISKTNKKMENKFARFDFFHEQDAESGFPLGSYGVEVAIGGKVLAKKMFRVLEKKEYDKEIERIRKENLEKEEREKARRIMNRMRSRKLRNSGKRFEVVEEGNLAPGKNYWVSRKKLLYIFLCFLVIFFAWYMMKYFVNS